MKSAYELAMERLNAEHGEPRQLNDAEKEALAELDRKYEARLAEVRMGFDTRMSQAASFEDLQNLRQEMAAELTALEEKREADKDRIWSGESA